MEWVKVWGNSLPASVRRAKDYGVDGIFCSNHGGPPALEALPDVVKAADGMPVLFDSGVRTGADVAKVLALGATAVGLGRPYAYALAVDGSAFFSRTSCLSPGS